MTLNEKEQLGFPPARLEEETLSSEYNAAIKAIKSGLDEEPLLKAEASFVMRNPELPGNELAPEQKTAIIQCVDKAMNMMGENGKEVLLEILYRRYGVVEDDVVERPDEFMRLVKRFMGSTTAVLERRALDEIQHRLRISGSTLEEVIDILRGQADYARAAQRENLRKGAKSKKKSELSHPVRIEYHTP